MKKGFTLIELLVVIGIMGMLATVSIGGYTAVTRGMAERGALDAAAGIAEATLQRAQIDRTKTYLYLFNEVTRLDSDDEVGIVCGLAIAVRPIGRFSRIVGNVYCDEFGDLNQSYSSLRQEGEEESASQKEQGSATMRIYNMSTKDYATVREGVYLDDSSQAIDLEPDSTTSANTAANGGSQGTGRKIYAYGFQRVSGATFQVGDEYGQEFAVMRLPPGYVFASSATLSSSSDLGIKKVGVVEVNATDSTAPSLQVYSRRPDGSFKSIGSTIQVKDFKR